MKTQDYYHHLKVGGLEKKAKVTKLELRTPRGRKKLYIKAIPENGKELTINEVWYTNNEGKLVTQGLWLDLDASGNIYPTSTLARLLTTLGLNSIGDLVGKELKLRPKENGFLCIVLN